MKNFNNTKFIQKETKPQLIDCDIEVSCKLIECIVRSRGALACEELKQKFERRSEKKAYKPVLGQTLYD